MHTVHNQIWDCLTAGEFRSGLALFKALPCNADRAVCLNYLSENDIPDNIESRNIGILLAQLFVNS